MKSQMRSSLLAGVVMLCGWVNADIPGVFVVQEARIEDPITTTASTGKRFGNSGLAWVGDFDGDQIQDVIVGAGKSYSDTGSLQIVMLDRAGKMKGAPIGITSREPSIRAHLSQVSSPDNFGGAVEVVRPFSATENCALIATSSTNKGKLWAIKACRSAGNVTVDEISVIDSLNSPILQGFGTLRIGESIRVIDLVDGKYTLAVTIPGAVNPQTKTSLGAVLLVSLHPETLAWARVGQIPNSWSSDDPVMEQLVGASAGFGRSVAKMTTTGAGLRLAIASTGDKPQARIHVVELSRTGVVSADKPILPTVGSESVLGLYSVASADFNHDGVLDLAIGQPQKQGKSLVANVGAVSIALMDLSGNVKAIKAFGQLDGNGFVDSNMALVEKSYFGIDLLAGDFDGDLQADILVGASGATGVPSSIWPLRMKSAPWQLKVLDTLVMVADPISVMLSEYVRGNSLKWSISEVDPPSTGSLASCAVLQSQGAPTLRCTPFSTNGISKWKVTASDTGNVPATEHFQLSLDVVVRVKDQNIPPRHTSVPLPTRILLREDQGDSSVLVFSKHFEDPDGKPLRIDLTPLNGSVASLLNYFLSTNYDTLHLQPIPLRFGSCSLQVAAKDDAGAVILDTVVVQVAHVNHAPVALDDSYRIVESTPSRFGVRGNDKDVDPADPLVFSIAIAPRHGRAAMDADTIVYVPDSFYLGNDSIRYRLKDGVDSAFAWVRIVVARTTDPLRVHKVMRDTVVEENEAPIEVRIDSLFFSGDRRFEVSINEPSHSCQGLASVALDPGRKWFKISPLPNAFGSCRIWILESVEGNLSDTMRLELKPILTPYVFPQDTVTLRMATGKRMRMALDTVDLDKDTLIYSPLSIPSWATLEPYGLVLDPGAEEGKILIEVRKKSLPGVVFLDPSDTLVVYAMFEATSVRRRSIGNNGTSYTFDGQGAMLVKGGNKPFRIDLLTLDGRSFSRRSGAENEQIRLHIPSGSRMLILRLIEGGRMFQTPLMRHR